MHSFWSLYVWVFERKQKKKKKKKRRQKIAYSLNTQWVHCNSFFCSFSKFSSFSRMVDHHRPFAHNFFFLSINANKTHRMKFTCIHNEMKKKDKHSISIIGIVSVLNRLLFNCILLHVCCFWACWIFTKWANKWLIQMNELILIGVWRCYFIFTSFHFMSKFIADETQCTRAHFRSMVIQMH